MKKYYLTKTIKSTEYYTVWADTPKGAIAAYEICGADPDDSQIGEASSEVKVTGWEIVENDTP